MRTQFLVLVLASLSCTVAAQTPVDPAAAGLPPFGAKAGMMTMSVADMDASPVKGAPFCATVATEHTQAFADGNRIHTSDKSSLCRDSEGRTRRDAELNLMGAAAPAQLPKLITIVDPVAGHRYMLDSQNKVAYRIPLKGGEETVRAAAVPGPGDKGPHVIMYQRIGAGGPSLEMNDNVFFRQSGQSPDAAPPTTENLGDQTIDGIHATGTRVTTTIPAGKMGNEQPILVTSERWYSPELKTTIMTKHTDPWAGELKTEFTNVNTSEPDSSLFTIPGDYKVVDDKAGPFMIHKPLPPPQ
jgi:hypothetical protein